MAGRFGPISLHDELEEILRERDNRWMTTSDLADEVNRRAQYRKEDGSAVTAFQVHGRTRNYSRLFERDGSRVRLRIDLTGNLAEYGAARSETGRYTSFDYCFNYFQSFAERDQRAAIGAAANLETSCLQLGFYLASWGMYRGSTKLLQRSVAHLKPAIGAIAAAPREIWSCDANDYSEDACALILDTSRQLRSLYPSASDTLVTKIMLGTFGCVPAFDYYFCKGFHCRRFDRPALERIAEFYSENADLIDRNRWPTVDFRTGLDTERRYPRAKVVDMIFWIQGVRLTRG